MCGERISAQVPDSEGLGSLVCTPNRLSEDGLQADTPGLCATNVYTIRVMLSITPSNVFRREVWIHGPCGLRTNNSKQIRREMANAWLWPQCNCHQPRAPHKAGCSSTTSSIYVTPNSSRAAEIANRSRRRQPPEHRSRTFLKSPIQAFPKKQRLSSPMQPPIMDQLCSSLLWLTVGFFPFTLRL